VPISRENAALYPPDWSEISHRIRKRSGGNCECRGECGTAHPAKRCLAHQGRPIDPFADPPVIGGHGRGVVLTTAHLNHDPTDCDDVNLKAMCQRCHLAYDRDLHTRNSATTRRKRKDAAHEAAGQGRLL
jgi:hypothetical protein